MTNEERSRGGFQDHPENINLEGRPKGSKSITTELKKLLSEEEFAELIKQKILSGDIKVLLHAYDQIDGKAVQKQVLMGDEERPVRLIIEQEEDGEEED